MEGLVRQPFDLRVTLTIFIVSFIVGGCVGTPRAPSIPAENPTEVVGGSRPPTTVGEEVVRVAATLIGSPYKFGGDSPGQGFDCSGLVHYSFDQLGFDVPRTAADQRHA